MVYDDTRWVQRLQLMGCWDEREARRKADALRIERSGVQASMPRENNTDAATGSNGSFHTANGAGNPGRFSTTIFDATQGNEVHVQPRGSGFKPRQARVDDGFDSVALTTTGGGNTYFFDDNSVTGLTVFSQVHSVRGHARQEFAKIYRVLAPLYVDTVKCKITQMPRFSASIEIPISKRRCSQI